MAKTRSMVLMVAVATTTGVLMLDMPGANAWGPVGHRVVAKIAEEHLTPEAKDGVAEILPSWAAGSMAPIANWADQVRHTPYWAWTEPLHFIDCPDGVCKYDYNRDCIDHRTGAKNMCVAGAIKNYTAQLVDGIAAKAAAAASTNRLASAVSSFREMSRLDLQHALFFLVHFVGDIHQPLHVSHLGDRGGNLIHVHFDGRATNLHSLWDSGLIGHALSTKYHTEAGFTDGLSERITDDDVAEWSKCPLPLQFEEVDECPNKYADESIDDCCTWAYGGVKDGDVIPMKYYDTRMPIVEEQLMKGGVRLAVILNGIFSGGQAKDVGATDS